MPEGWNYSLFFHKYKYIITMVDANMINDHVPCLFRYAAVWSSLSSLQGR